MGIQAEGIQQKKMKIRQICVNAPEIVMSGDIAITAAIAVTTKAKLDSVAIKGSCECLSPEETKKERKDSSSSDSSSSSSSSSSDTDSEETKEKKSKETKKTKEPKEKKDKKKEKKVNKITIES